MFKIFDAHCDTVTTAISKGEKLRKNNLHNDIERLAEFEKAVQVFAIWFDKEDCENLYESAERAIDFFKKQADENRDIFNVIYNGEELEKSRNVGGILSIEGCEILEGNKENISRLYEKGIRIMTICWNYENELGYGAATEIKKGLKKFGMECVEEMNRCGIIADISHLNEQGAYDVCQRAEKVIASHSNAKRVCGHLRNLTDEQIKMIKEKNGMIGINLYPPFLSEDTKAGIYDIEKHIEHISEIAGENNIGFGCDFDGIDDVPENISSISDIYKVRDAIERDFGEKFADKIFFDNFYEYMKIYIGG
ncbi:MAG: dipeptidase [Firmicutes bacterium]|nr:dipeptidase [Bacillota bacterium]